MKILEQNSTYTIGQIEKITGFSKDILRKWESRYGYPLPKRDINGNRLYDQEILKKLNVIRALMNRGNKVGNLIKLDHDDLLTFLHVNYDCDEKNGDVFSLVMKLSESGKSDSIRLKLQEQLENMGLKDFVVHFIAPFVIEIGRSWHLGKLSISQEHLITSEILRVLNEANSKFSIHKDDSVVALLTTPPQELHTVGLKMAESLFLIGGAKTIYLDSQLPINEITIMAKKAKAKVVAISVSAAFPLKNLKKFIKDLRHSLEPNIEIWLGGTGAEGLKRTTGITFLNLLDIEKKLKHLR